MFSNRSFIEKDAGIIVEFPQSKDELFYMFPKADFPLQPETLIKQSKLRFSPTVVLFNDDVVGYGNFICVKYGDFCSIGNIVVNPLLRRTGIATYLIGTMLGMAFKKQNAKYVQISCFSQNTSGLLLYKKLGFASYEIESREKHNGKQVDLIHMRRYMA